MSHAERNEQDDSDWLEDLFGEGGEDEEFSIPDKDSMEFQQYLPDWSQGERYDDPLYSEYLNDLKERADAGDAHAQELYNGIRYHEEKEQQELQEEHERQKKEEEELQTELEQYDPDKRFEDYYKSYDSPEAEEEKGEDNSEYLEDPEQESSSWRDDPLEI